MPPRHLVSLHLLGRAAAITIDHLKSTHFPLNPPRNGEFFQYRLFSAARLSRGGHAGRGGGSRTATSAAVGSSKSLMDDEAELSDWISDINTGTSKFGSGSDADDFPTAKRSGGSSRNGSFRDRNRDRNGDGSSFASRGSGRGGRAGGRGGGVRRQFDDDIKNSRNALSKRFGSDLDDDDEESDEFGASLSSKGKSKKSRNSFSKKFESDDDDDEDDDEDDEFGSSSSRGRGRNSRVSYGKRGYCKGDNEVGFSSSRGRGGGRGGRGGKDMVRGGRDNGLGFGDRSPIGGRDNGLGFGDRSRRGGRDNGVGVGVGNKSRRDGRNFDFGALAEEKGVGEEEDEDDGLSGFEDDLFGDFGGKKDEQLLMDAGKCLGSAEAVEVGGEAPRKTSGGNESYLSQTRYFLFTN